MIIENVSPNAANLMTATRAIGYSFEAALADIIDNSISKNAKKIDVYFDSIDIPYLVVLDNGTGMTYDELIVAMKYGSQGISEDRKSDDLGRFGLGLKMASLSQCRKLTVISKKNHNISAAKWDLDYIEQVDEWALQTFTEDELDDIPHIAELKKLKSGTIVLWEYFDRISESTSNTNISKVFDEKIDIARDHIALVFHRYINPENISKKLIIRFNNAEVEAIDPFMQNHVATQKLEEQIIVIGKSKIKVKPFILPYLSKLSSKDKKILNGKDDLRRTQGFYLYRNKRLIIWGTWFRLIKQYELNKLSRIRVDIPNDLDNIWNIDIKKSTASLPDLVKDILQIIVNKTVKTSESVYKYRGRKTNNDNITHIWNRIDNRGKFQYMINRDIPAYKILEDNLDEQAIVYLDMFIKIIENSFPYQAVYYDVAKNESNPSEILMEEQEVYQIAQDMISKVENDGNVDEFINYLSNIDFFIKYPKVIDAIRKDYRNE